MNWITRPGSESQPKTDAQDRSSVDPTSSASAPGPVAPNPGKLSAAVCAATDAALGLEWLSRLDSETALAEVAQHARIWEIRLAAAQRISDPDLLARIVEATRHRDKRVYRHCFDLLRARRRTLAHAMRAAELAAGFRTLLDGPSDRQALQADRFDELETELNRLRQEYDTPQECLDLAAAARERVRGEARALRDLGSDAAEAEALCAQIAATARPGDAGVFRGKLKDIAERPSRRVAWLADHPTAAALAHSIERAHAILDALMSDPDAIEACNRFIESRARSSRESGGDSPGDSAALDAEWEDLPKPKDPSARSVLQTRWMKARESLVTPRLPEPVVSAPASRQANALPAGERDAVRELLDRLALELQAGRLAEAEETERRISARSGAWSLPESMARRLRRDRAQLGRMRDWARWGNDQAREHLIQAAEKLLQGERDLDALAAAVPGLREEWKRLDATRPAARSQWERFDAVLTQAFQPVLEVRAQRAREEKTAAAAKAALCDQSEAWAASIDWESADFRAIAARRHEIGNQWRALPFAGFRGERQLRKRFDKLIKPVDERLGAARQAEIRRREDLIREAEALREAPLLGEAIKKAVALQARWKDSAGGVHLSRQDDQQLWQRFRAACEALFARRDAQRAERDAERDRHLNERKALLAAFESAIAGSDAGAVARAQSEFRRAWGGAQRTARDRIDPLEGRARDLARLAERRIEALRFEAKRGRFELLARRSALSERLEAAAAGGQGIAEALGAEVKQQWQDLPPLAAKEEKALQGRMAVAAQASAAKLEKGRAERESLLLDLELALDLPSPPSAAGARRERQLLRLRERFRPGTAEPPDPETLVLRWYATAARSEPEHDLRMAAIVGALVKR